MTQPMGLAILLVLSMTSPVGQAQQSPTDGLFIFGSVVDDNSGAPIVGAEVVLMRNSTVRGKSGQTMHNVLATGRSDGLGQFSLGRVSLASTRVDFPIEGSVSVDFTIFKDRRTLTVAKAEFVGQGLVGTARSVTMKIGVR